MQFQFNSTFESLNDDIALPVESADELSTIDVSSFRHLLDNPIHSAAPQASTSISTIAVDCPASDSTTSCRALSEDLIQTFVTPSKDVKKISSAMQRDNDPRKCALKLLPYFFSADELKGSNADGSHGKRSLDPTKLNSLRGKLFYFMCYSFIKAIICTYDHVQPSSTISLVTLYAIYFLTCSIECRNNQFLQL